MLPRLPPNQFGGGGRSRGEARDTRRERKLCQSGDVAHTELLHHGLAVAATVCRPRSSKTAISLLVLPRLPGASTCNSRAKTLRAPAAHSDYPNHLLDAVQQPFGTWGLRLSPPLETVRKASTNSGSDAFFNTKARAPERIALITEFSSSYIDRMTTLAPDSDE